MHFANPKAFTRPLRKLLKSYLLSVTAGDIMLGEVADHLCVNDLDRGLSDKERIRAAAISDSQIRWMTLSRTSGRIRKASYHTLRFVICMIPKVCGRR